MFSTFPLLIKLVLVTFTFLVLYSIEFVGITIGSVLIYLILMVIINEWRAKFFKDKTDKDNTNNQKAVDSLINFETVKYFNAEDHE